MNAAPAWDDAIREHDRRVYLSVLALGLAPDRAREVTQMTWTRLIEQYAKGKLADLELPGLAIRQARFYALNEHQRARTEMRVLAAVPEPVAGDPERALANREELERVLAALETCSPQARRVFRLAMRRPAAPRRPRRKRSASRYNACVRSCARRAPTSARSSPDDDPRRYRAVRDGSVRR